MKQRMRCCLVCLLVCLLAPLMAGCVCSKARVKHNMTPPGAVGFIVQPAAVAAVLLPNKDGELVAGPALLNPGTMIYIPKTGEEVIERLKAAGVKFETPPPAPPR